jgi:hypothetical protein
LKRSIRWYKNYNANNFPDFIGIFEFPTPQNVVGM